MQQHSQLYVENMLNYENTSIRTMQSSNMMTNNQDFNVISDNRNGVSYYGSEVDLEQVKYDNTSKLDILRLFSYF